MTSTTPPCQLLIPPPSPSLFFILAEIPRPYKPFSVLHFSPYLSVHSLLLYLVIHSTS
ncbi:hypothetical protein RchiOBHm_Chr4g0421491 [Rosa chinensis]|uniref:Uncharacterized protein n=1 Tax=Rosa chinensis TaxID=74649 RepID=A0A2P6QY64_ROSCH|nr:hypothetical protein RchiOBHm_Chr4g0421491 [Rosa chinensis]